MATNKTAVDASRTNAWNIEPERLVLIEDQTHPLYDPRVHLPVDESLVLNIGLHGVIEPVIICKDGPDLVVVDGRQRVKAAREANVRLRAEGKLPMLVTCMVRKGDDASLFGVMVSTNELRTEDSPLWRAEKLQRYLAMGRTEAEAAIVFGVSRQTIRNWIELLNLDVSVKLAVDAGVIGATAAVQVFSGLKREDQREKLKALQDGENGTLTTPLELKISGAQSSGKRPAISATKARAHVDGGERPATRMRSRKQIEAKLDDLPVIWTAAQALHWVLGHEV